MLFTLRFVLYLIPAIFGLNACTLLPPVHTTTNNTYVINQINSTIPVAKSSQLTLLVKTPNASPAFDTGQIAYTSKPFQLDYFAKNYWVNTPAQMLLPLMVQSLQNTHYFKAITTSAFYNHYDLILTTQLIEFKQDFLLKPSQFRLSLQSQLISNKDQTIIATKVFKVSEAAIEDTPYGGVIAANRAVTKLLDKLSKFCLANTTA